MDPRPLMSISTGHRLGASGAFGKMSGASLSLNTSSREQTHSQHFLGRMCTKTLSTLMT